MKTLTTNQVHEWLTTRGIKLTQDNYPISIREEDEVKFSIPSDSGSKFALASALFTPFAAKTALLWIREWGVWPTSERRHLFDRFLASYGLPADLNHYPGFEIQPNEQEEGLSLYTFPILFLWDAYVIDQDATQTVYTSHEGIGWLFSRDAAHRQRIVEQTRQ